jgi:Fe2+ transport system protein FeoA
MTPANSMKLSDVPNGSQVRIHHLSSRPEVSARLRAMGFCENAVIRCITKGYGNIICEVYDTRIGLNSSLAQGIHVSHAE